MITWQALVRAATIAAVVLAGAASVRRRELRPLAALMVFAVACDFGLAAVRLRWMLPWQEQARAAGIDPFATPATGAALVATQVYRVTWIAWGPSLCAVAAHAFGARRPWPMALLWASCAVALLLGDFWGYRAKPVYLLVELGSLSYAIASAVAWVEKKAEREPNHTIALACLMFHGAYLLAYRVDAWKQWDVARVALFGLFAVISLISGGAACSTFKRSSVS